MFSKIFVFDLFSLRISGHRIFSTQQTLTIFLGLFWHVTWHVGFILQVSGLFVIFKTLNFTQQLNHWKGKLKISKINSVLFQKQNLYKT